MGETLVNSPTLLKNSFKSPRGRPALPGALRLPHWNVIAAANVSLRGRKGRYVIARLAAASRGNLLYRKLSLRGRLCRPWQSPVRTRIRLPRRACALPAMTHRQIAASGLRPPRNDTSTDCCVAPLLAMTFQSNLRPSKSGRTIFLFRCTLLYNFSINRRFG